MSDQTHEHISVSASPDHVYEVSLDFERYPEWANDVKEVSVLERDGEGRGIVVEFRVAGLGRSIRYVLSYDYTQAPSSFSWRLVESEVLRRLEGRYGFESEGAGTRVTCELAVDVAVPFPGLVKRRAAAMITGTALRQLKKEAER